MQPTQDEEARINNGSMSDRETREGMDKTSTIKSGHGGLQPSKSQQSHNTHSTFNQNTFMRPPGTSHTGYRKTMKN